MAEAHYSSNPDYDPPRREDEYRPEPPPPPEPPLWMDGSVRIGIHTSIAGDLIESLDRAHRLGSNALQIFSASPRMWSRGMEKSLAEAQRFRERRRALRLGPVVIHDNYLINLASPDRVLRVRSIQAFHEELVRGVVLGADYLVAHPGSSRGVAATRALEDVAGALRQAARGVKFNGLRILLENTAGQGTALGSRFEELARILDACPELPLGVCLDTAHMFAAGYDIRSADGLERTLEAIERSIGLASVFVVHVNDSKAPLGSRVDRHEHIGRGKIGLEAFRRIVNHPLVAFGAGASGCARAFILETPIDRPGDDRRNVRTLWKLVGVRLQPTRGAEDGFRTKSKVKRRKPKARKSKSSRKSKGRKRAGC